MMSCSSYSLRRAGSVIRILFIIPLNVIKFFLNFRTVDNNPGAQNTDVTISCWSQLFSCRLKGPHTTQCLELSLAVGCDWWGRDGNVECKWRCICRIWWSGYLNCCECSSMFGPGGQSKTLVEGLQSQPRAGCPASSVSCRQWPAQHSATLRDAGARIRTAWSYQGRSSTPASSPPAGGISTGRSGGTVTSKSRAEEHCITVLSADQQAGGAYAW